MKTLIRLDARRGFSLIEIMIAAVLSTMLLLMVSNMWFSLGRSAAGNAADVALTAEARLAGESFRRDFSGCLPGAVTGTKRLGRFVGRMSPAGDQLLLCFDGSPANGTADWNAPDTVIEYSLQGDQLIRSDSQTGAEIVVADGVTSFDVEELSDGVRLDLTLQRRDISRTFNWITQDP
jgi:prepilin-type N-terminal cleavage/methylation domain-containing protein